MTLLEISGGGDIAKSVVDKLDTNSLLIVVLSIIILYFTYRVIFEAIVRKRSRNCDSISEEFVEMMRRVGSSFDNVELVMREIRILQEINVKKYSNTLSDSAVKLVFQRVAHLSRYRIERFVRDNGFDSVEQFVINLFNDDKQLMNVLKYKQKPVGALMDSAWIELVMTTIVNVGEGNEVEGALDIVFERIINEFNSNVSKVRTSR